MKRFTIAAVFLIILNVLTTAVAQENVFEEGKQYQRLAHDVKDNVLVQELAKQDGSKIHVMEFFSYGCHWCYKLDPYIETWHKGLPSDVSFQRIPVEFQPSWRTLTKAYYTAEKLNALDKIQIPLFEVIHSEKMDNTSDETLRQFFVSKGIKEEDFNRVYDSFDVERKQKWANAISRALRVNAVPAMVVLGPHGIFLTTISMAGSEENLLKVVDHLIKTEQDGKAPAENSNNSPKK